MLSEFPPEHASNSPVKFVADKRFAVRLFWSAVVNYQHTGAHLTCATLFLFLPHLTSYVIYIKKNLIG